MNIKQLISILLLVCILPFTGCTYCMYKLNKQSAYKTYAYSTKDDAVIKAFHAGDTVGLGVNLAASDIIFRSWGSLLTQAAGAVLDVGTVYALTETGTGQDVMESFGFGSHDTVNINNSGDGTVNYTDND